MTKSADLSLRVLSALAIAGAMLSGCAKRAAPPPPGPPTVGVVTLQTQTVPLTVELPGRTTAYTTSDVRPQVNGVIKARLFVEGSDVHAGQVLYQIDPAPYQAAYDQAKGVLANAQAALTTARLKAQRYAELVKINAVSRQDNDDAQAAYKQAQATGQQNRASLEAAAINLGYTKVRAPISGRIGRSIYTAGALAQSGQTNALATIQALAPIYVDVTQSSDELLKLRQAISKGQLGGAGGAASAEVRLKLSNDNLYPEVGKLRFTDAMVDPTTGSVTLRAVFPNPRQILLPGMYVRAELTEGAYTNAILAPQQGVSHDPKGGSTAMVVGSDGKAQPRQIKTVGVHGDQWIVTDGLKPGDQLIVEGLLTLQPGTPVKTVPAHLAAGTAGAAPASGNGG